MQRATVPACRVGRTTPTEDPPHDQPNHRGERTSTLRVVIKRYSFSVVHDSAPEYPAGITVPSVVHAAVIARRLIGSAHTESAITLFLTARHRVIRYAEIARGTLNAARCQPRDVLVPALHANAAAVILAHNHPSGDCKPSAADRVATAILRAAGDLIGIAMRAAHIGRVRRRGRFQRFHVAGSGVAGRLRMIRRGGARRAGFATTSGRPA